MSAAQRLQTVASHLYPNASFEKYRVHRRPDQVPYLSALDPIRFLLRSAMVYADRTAVIHGEDRSFTYQQFADRVLKLANLLIHEYGLKSGDRVAILCQNIPATLEAFYAVPAAAGILVPLNYRLTAAELEYVIGHSGATIVLVQDELQSLISDKVRSSTRLIEVASYYRPNCQYERLLAATEPKLGWNDLPLTKDENAVMSINYTSGSTGRPKGVMSTFRGCYLTAVSNCIHVQLTPETVYLWTLPMFHCNGWNFPWAVVAAGGTQIMLNKLDYALIWKLLKEKGVTHYNGAPTVQNEICNHKDAVRLDRPVRTFSGGAALSATLIRRLNALNIIPRQVYGLTETYGPSTLTYDVCVVAHLPEEEQYAMYARPGFNAVMSDEIRVLDRETAQDVPPDGKTIGEICMTGNQVMKGYYNDPDATEKAFRAGVFWTGDLAVRHPDGAVEIVDRSKDVIISGGENISSIEVENVICELDAVMECAIVGCPDEKWGERPYAFIVLKEGHSITADQVIAHCRKKLAGYKCPSQISFVKSIPKTSTGKIQKYLIREQLWKSYKKRIN